MNPPRPISLFSVVIVIAIISGISLPARAQSVDEKLENMQQQIDELRILLIEERAAREKERQEFQAVTAAQEKERQEFKQEVETIKSTASEDRWPVAGFGGQYRINFYNADNDTNTVVPDTDDQTAARARIRQNVDLKFSEQFKTHLQLELQHTTDNVTRTASRRGGTSTNVSVRHAVMEYTFGNGTNLQAGLVPLHDYYHDTLFSSDWDYNPLAASVIIPLGAGKARLFAANLDEGAENIENDDFVHYQADYSLPLGSGGQVNVGGTILNLQDDASVGTNDSFHYNAAAGITLPFGNDLTFNGSVIGSWSDSSLLGTTDDASGVAVLAELTGPAGPGNFGVMVSYASGESDGTGFLPPMAFAQTFGYWGYTGILTVQGPTDTGFDFDAINISNNGYGLTTVQAKYAFPIMTNLGGYLAAGWFGNTDASGRDNTVGYDLLGMGTYRFNKVFALDFGFGYASLNDSVSGYFQGVQNGGLGSAFNQAAGTDRDKWALFGRLQAEF
ncbi:MAG: hypothetical protein KAJ03_05995 [Gammaproteobacteria bacterium]|nr:hypothetical protein [Gammaproteobacteria bacterium]